MTGKTKNVKLISAIAGAFTILGIALYATHLESLGWYLILISSGCGIIITFVGGIILKDSDLLAGMLLWPITVGAILWWGNHAHAIRYLIVPLALVVTFLAGVTSTVIHTCHNR